MSFPGGDPNDPNDPFTLAYAASHPFQGIPTSPASTDTLTITLHAPREPPTFIPSLLPQIQSLTDTYTSTHLFHHPLPPTWHLTDNHLTLTHPYANAVDDEWFLVSLALHISTAHPTVYLHLTDSSDDEFLLVEAAHTLPRWLTPDSAPFRPWLHQGRLYLIPPTPGTRKPPPLTLSSALTFLAHTPVADGTLWRDRLLESEALARAKQFPARSAELVHRTVLTVPLRVAGILHRNPRLVSAAAEAFCARDPVAMKCLGGATWDHPVQLPAALTKLHFAQCRAQRWRVPRGWPVDDAELGAKITAGLEMLVARENAKVFFGAAQEGVVAAVREAEAAGEVAEEVLAALPRVEDALDWMDVGFEEFDQGLKSAGAEMGMNDKAQEENIKRIVERFERFLGDDRAGVEGAELSEDGSDDDDDDDDDDDESGDDEDDTAELDFDEEEFARMMRAMMGMPVDGDELQTAQPPPAAAAPAKPAREPAKQVSFADPDPDAGEYREIREMQESIAAELKSAGVLKSTAGPSARNRITPAEDADDEHDVDDEDEVDIDYQLVANMLQSFKAQGGVAGPTGNLLAAMGIRLPRDDEEEEEEGGEERGVEGKGKGKGKALLQ